MTAQRGGRAEPARERDIQFRATLESLPVGIADLDFDGRILRANARLCELAGRRREALAGRRLAELLPPGDVWPQPDPLQGLRDGRTAEQVLELPILRDDGGTRWTRLTLSLQRDVAGQGAHLVAVVEDIDADRRERLALQRQSEQHRQVADMLPAAVYACDADGVLTFFNRRAAQLWGAEPRIGGPELRFGGVSRRYTPGGEPLPADETPMACALREGRSLRNRELVLEQPDGTRVPVLINVDPLRDAEGRIVGAIGAFVDLSQQKQTEAALDDRQERLRLALDAATMDAFEYDPATDRVRRDGTLGDSLGMPQEYPAAGYFALIHPEDRDGFFASLDALSPRQPVHAFEYRLCLPDGSLRWMADRAQARFDAQGRLQRLTGVFSDITERRATEAALAHERELLRQIVDRIPVLLCLLDPRRQHHELNRHFQAVLGWSADDARDGGLLARLFPDAAQRDAFEAFLAAPGGEWREWSEWSATARDGSRIACEWTCLRLADGTLVAIGLDVRQLRVQEQRLARLSERQALLLEVTRGLLQTGLDEAALARVAFEQAGAYLDADVCFNYRLDAEDDTMALVAGFGIPPALQASFRRLESGHGYCGTVAASRERIAADAAQIAQDERAELLRLVGVRAYACHPLLALDGRLLGTFSVASTRRSGFTPGELDFLQTLSHFIALAWERLHAEQALRRREEQLRVVLDAGQLGSWWRDLRSGDFHMDERAQAHFGFEVGTVSHRTLMTRMHPDDVERVEREVAAANAAPPGAYNRGIEYRVVHPDGGVRWLSVQAKVMREAPDSPRLASMRIGTSADITERKLIERALRETADDLERAQAVANVGSWRIDVSSGSLYWTSEVYRIFGIPLGAEIDYARFLACIHPEDRERVDALWQAALRGEAPYDVEHRILVGGETRWVREKAELEFDAQGQLRSGFGTVQDITERRRSEEALRESEARFRALADATPQMVWQTDPQGVFEYWNHQVEMLRCELGIAPESLLLAGVPLPEDPRERWNWLEVLHPDDREPTVQAWLQALRNGSLYEIEHRMRRGDGSCHWYLSRAVPMRDAEGRIMRWYGTSTDIDALRRADAALKEGAARMKAVVDTALDGIVTLDERGRIESVNPALEAMFGYRADELAGAPVSLLVPGADPVPGGEGGVPPQGALRLASAAEWQGRRRDGSLFPLELALGETRLAGRRVFTAFLHDITVRKSQQQALRRSADELAEADRRKDEFLATLAHELRNPLGPLRNAAQLLRVQAGAVPELRRTGAVIDRQVSHLARLIDDLLDVSRITRDKLELRRQRVTLAEIVDGALESSLVLVESQQHVLTVHLPPEEVSLDGDPVRLVQILQNLLDNAAKYTPAGGRIALAARLDGAMVELSVQDNGIGIPPASLARLFELFYQVDRSLERSRSGLGIGLTLVQRLVQMHGGSVEARSAGSGLGSEFLVRLPVAAVQPQASPLQPGPQAGAAVLRHRVLVADDNVDSVESMALLLQLAGHEVHVAYDGLQALQQAEQLRPTLALLDIGMPGLNGYETARRIRASDWGRDMLLVAQTGWGQEEDRRRSLEAGFDAHLTKPVDIDALMALLARPAAALPG